MAMMGSSWNGQGQQGAHPATDDEFQQFLDMAGMGNLADNIQFDFSDFNSASPGASQLMHSSMAPPTSEPLDTPMTGAHNVSHLLAAQAVSSAPMADAGLTGTSAGLHAGLQHSAVTSADGGVHASIATTLMPSQTPTDAISEIDAQIQYLQQQRIQQQQRQIEEQSLAFFTRQSQIAPPTPQSLELQAGTQFFASPDPRGQHHAQHPSQKTQQAMNERFQHFKEQQDVCRCRFCHHGNPLTTNLEH